jgi:hypothetical protein
MTTGETSYHKLNVDLDTLHGLRSPRRELGLSGVAIGFIGLAPDEGYTFTHHHREQEEVYLVVRGSGELLLDGVREPLTEGDAVRVSPPVRRALCAGPSGLAVICAGGATRGYPQNPNARYLIDDGVPHYDDIPPWYAGDAEVAARNAALAARRQRAQERRGEDEAVQTDHTRPGRDAG